MDDCNRKFLAKVLFLSRPPEHNPNLRPNNQFLVRRKQVAGFVVEVSVGLSVLLHDQVGYLYMRLSRRSLGMNFIFSRRLNKSVSPMFKRTRRNSFKKGKNKIFLVR